MSRKSKRLAARARRITSAKKVAAKEPPKTLTAAGGRASIQAADGEGKKLATFEGIAYTGVPMQPAGWIYPIVVELSSVIVPAQLRPALRQHDHNQIVGHTTSVKVSDKDITIAGVFSGEKQHTDKVTVPAGNGFEWQLSIGADPARLEFVEAGETATVNGQEWTGPLYIGHDTELGEFSFVPLGADGNTSATVSASKGRIIMNWKSALKFHKSQGMKAAAEYSDEDIDKMSEDEAKAALQKCMAEDAKDAEADGDEDSEVDAEESEVDEGTATDTDTEKKTAKGKAKAGKKPSVKSSIRREVAAAVDRELKAGRSKAAAETRRVNEIHARAQRHGGNIKIKVEGGREVDLVPHAIEAGWTPNDVELHALRAARPAAGPHFHVPGAPVMNEAVLECAMFDALGGQFRLFDADFYRKGEVTADGTAHRRVPEREERRITAELNARYPDQVRQAAHTHFKGRMGLQQLLTTLAAANGYRGPATFNDPNGWSEVAGYLAHGIRADGPSSINTPATLANVQNKLMLQGYLFCEQSHLEFCQVVPVKDLKPMKGAQLFGNFQFQPLSPAGEIQHATVGDNAYANQASIESRMVTLPIQYLLNDDQNGFAQIPMMLGRGWGLRVLDLVYTKVNNPGTDEGGSTNFFAATHTITGQSGNSNLSSGGGSTLTSAGLQAAKQLLDKQVDPANFPLGVDAEILLYPPELDVAAIELMNAQFIVMAGLASTAAASKQANTNIWKGRFKPVMSRYLSDSRYTGYSATAWYLFANPNVIPVFQIAALNGQMTPVIQTAGQDWQFNTLGISSRGWGGIGVEKQNFRGAVKSAGA